MHENDNKKKKNKGSKFLLRCVMEADSEHRRLRKSHLTDPRPHVSMCLPAAGNFAQLCSHLSLLTFFMRTYFC